MRALFEKIPYQLKSVELLFIRHVFTSSQLQANFSRGLRSCIHASFRLFISTPSKNGQYDHLERDRLVNEFMVEANKQQITSIDFPASTVHEFLDGRRSA